MVATAGKDGSPVRKPDWACRPCAETNRDRLRVPITVKMLSTQNARQLLCTYGATSECREGHEKTDNHLCKFADLAFVLLKKGAKDNPAGKPDNGKFPCQSSQGRPWISWERETK